VKKVLILGTAGMLGHVVWQSLSRMEDYKIFTASFPYKFPNNSYILDVLNKNGVEEIVNIIKPNVVINCIGLLIKGAVQNPANAIYINSWFPHMLSRIVRNNGGRLIHISTDCVYNGSRGGYTENDPYDVSDIYGMSKALGELRNDHDLTIRTSIIGPELNKDGEGLFQWFMNQRGVIKGYTHVFWSGLTTLELSKAIDASMRQGLAGLINIAQEKISKYDLLCLLKDIWQRTDIIIEPDGSKVVDKSLISTRNDFDFRLKSYIEMLQDLRYFMQMYSDLYLKNHFNIDIQSVENLH